MNTQANGSRHVFNSDDQNQKLLAIRKLLCASRQSSLNPKTGQKSTHSIDYIIRSFSSTRVFVYFLNLLNELRKGDKMRGFSRILSLFRSKFNKFNKKLYDENQLDK